MLQSSKMFEIVEIFNTQIYLEFLLRKSLE